MGKNSRFPWAVLKTDPQPLLHRDRTSYLHYKRAERTYSHWLAAYSVEEIAEFFDLPIREVEADIEHVQSMLPTRTLVAQHNDRNRLLLQRAEARKYQALLSDALSRSASDYIAAGLSPAAPLKEFREAVGMIEKPGGLSISLSQHTNVGNPAGITCAEDVLRRVRSQLDTVKPIEVEPEEEPVSGDDCKPAEEIPEVEGDSTGE